jgi:flagellar biosynthesis/type III secretory pathway M-ring protein FliF/YscJ
MSYLWIVFWYIQSSLSSLVPFIIEIITTIIAFMYYGVVIRWPSFRLRKDEAKKEDEEGKEEEKELLDEKNDKPTKTEDAKGS